MIEWTGTQNKIGVEGECRDPVSVILQRVEQLALKAQDSERFDGEDRGRQTVPRSRPRCEPCGLKMRCIALPCR